jgi:hypothetical protein
MEQLTEPPKLKKPGGHFVGVVTLEKGHMNIGGQVVHVVELPPEYVPVGHAYMLRDRSMLHWYAVAGQAKPIGQSRQTPSPVSENLPVGQASSLSRLRDGQAYPALHGRHVPVTFDANVPSGQTEHVPLSMVMNPMGHETQTVPLAVAVYSIGQLRHDVSPGPLICPTEQLRQLWTFFPAGWLEYVPAGHALGMVRLPGQ